MRDSVKRVVGILLLVLFMGYYGSSTLFPHTHNIEGETITHSHPYLPSAGHSHSASAIQIIGVLSNIVFVTAVGFVFATIISSSAIIYKVVTELVQSVCSIHCRLRAPPVC